MNKFSPRDSLLLCRSKSEIKEMRTFVQDDSTCNNTVKCFFMTLSADCLRYMEALEAVGINANNIENVTVEAAPVVHGRWEHTPLYVTTAYGQLDIYKCSICGKDVTIDDYDDYCPSCGAKMDGESLSREATLAAKSRKETL